MFFRLQHDHNNQEEVVVLHDAEGQFPYYLDCLFFQKENKLVPKEMSHFRRKKFYYYSGTDPAM